MLEYFFFTLIRTFSSSSLIIVCRQVAPTPWSNHHGKADVIVQDTHWNWQLAWMSYRVSLRLQNKSSWIWPTTTRYTGGNSIKKLCHFSGINPSLTYCMKFMKRLWQFVLRVTRTSNSSSSNQLYHFNMHKILNKKLTVCFLLKRGANQDQLSFGIQKVTLSREPLQKSVLCTF